MSALPTKILLITGPAGIGKSTLCWEISRLLAEQQVAHAVIESDEIDRVYPKPGAEELSAIMPGSKDISAATLQVLWSVYRRLGHHRLLMSGVMMHLDFDRKWITQAIPDAMLSVVRLSAGEQTLRERLARRENSDTLESQTSRSLRQARFMIDSPAEALHLDTDGRTAAQLAQDVLRQSGWAPISTEY